MIREEEITGVILAGGKSTRMGQDKAMLVLNGKPLIQHVAEVLQAVLAEVIVSANSRAYDFLSLPIVKDVHSGYGPLGGIHTVLCSVTTPYIFTAPCDTPLLVPAMIKALFAEADPDVITIASSTHRLQPLMGVYPLACRSAMCEFLESGQRKVKDFLARATYRTVHLDAWAERLQNINEAGQYRALMR